MQNVNDPSNESELYRSLAANESNFMGALFVDCFHPVHQVIPTYWFLIDPEIAVGLYLNDNDGFRTGGPLDCRLGHHGIKALLLMRRAHKNHEQNQQNVNQRNDI